LTGIQGVISVIAGVTDASPLCCTGPEFPTRQLIGVWYVIARGNILTIFAGIPLVAYAQTVIATGSVGRTNHRVSLPDAVAVHMGHFFVLAIQASPTLLAYASVCSTCSTTTTYLRVGKYFAVAVKSLRSL